MTSRSKPAPTAAPPSLRPTSTEVAKLAGVSRTTVSFVLNGVTDKGISEATRERVLEAARELGYEPNAVARSLAGGATGTIALVIPKAEHLYVDAFLAQLVASINGEAHHHGLKLLIESTEDEGREPGGFMQLVRSRRIDGLIVANLRTAEVEHLQQLREGGLPLVVFGCELPDARRFHTMGDDTWASAQMAVGHLIDLGHRRIGFVNYASPELHSAAQRERGWREALRQHGIRIDPAWVVNADVSADSGYRAAQQLLARDTGITALFAGNDTVAFGALRALREAGLRVPEDIAVVGYDDVPLAAFAAPPLTTVHTDPIAHGRLAVRLLTAQLRGEDVRALAPLPAPKLVVRASCGAVMSHGSPTTASGKAPARGRRAAGGAGR